MLKRGFIELVRRDQRFLPWESSRSQCTNSDGDNDAPCLLKGPTTPYLMRSLATNYLLREIATHYLLRGLATPYLMRGLATFYLLRGLATPYLLRRHYSVVIAFRPEVTFVASTIPMDRSNMKWFCLRNIKS
uniref:Uncharacterized protein n=1 Tax=Tanacetum cinerariifolium TaxID=118510 RepID=A0A699HMP9_TANCI|nr:hypothetical protein [Tanacetum cinerariifolium]